MWLTIVHLPGVQDGVEISQQLKDYQLWIEVKENAYGEWISEKDAFYRRRALLAYSTFIVTLGKPTADKFDATPWHEGYHRIMCIYN